MHNPPYMIVRDCALIVGSDLQGVILMEVTIEESASRARRRPVAALAGANPDHDRRGPVRLCLLPDHRA